MLGSSPGKRDITSSFTADHIYHAPTSVSDDEHGNLGPVEHAFAGGTERPGGESDPSPTDDNEVAADASADAQQRVARRPLLGDGLRGHVDGTADTLTRVRDEVVELEVWPIGAPLEQTDGVDDHDAAPGSLRQLERSVEGARRLARLIHPHDDSLRPRGLHAPIVARSRSAPQGRRSRDQRSGRSALAARARPGHDGSTATRPSVLGTLDGATVALEVDGYDVASGSGWYVTVAGVAKEITVPADAASRRLHQLRVDPWAPRPRDRWMAVLPVGITGRRVARDGGSDAGWFAGVPAS